MAYKSQLTAEHADVNVKDDPNESLLRFIVYGPVDGKNALIERLLHESTPKRKCVVVDTPDGVSSADLAIILVDASVGIGVQTLQHSHIASLLRISKVVLAVSGMDAAGYAREIFDPLLAEYRLFARRLGMEDVNAIPISTLKGDNVVAAPSANMPWYRGPSLMGYLESVALDDATRQKAMRFPVERVSGLDEKLRGLAGVVAGGTVRAGDRVRALPSGRESRVARIVTEGGDVEVAGSGQSVTLVLEDEIDVSRGDILAAADAPPGVADQFQATLIWMHEEPLLPGRSYVMRIGTSTVSCSVTALKYKLDVNTMEHVAAKQLARDEIGVCNIATDRMIAYDSYAENRHTGGFILIDKSRNDTAGAGLIHFALRRSDNIHWQALDVNRQARSAIKNQKASVLWFTGLSGAGKSTIANNVEKRLHALGRHTYLLDGDNVRHGLNRDLGFTEADRVENIRRVAEVSKLMADAGLIVMVAFISPFRAERQMARELFAPGEFYEIFVDVPLAEAERRDRKGLYKKARRGELKNFTGIDSPYEAPENPDMRIDTTALSAEEAGEMVVRRLTEAGRLED